MSDVSSSSPFELGEDHYPTYFLPTGQMSLPLAMPVPLLGYQPDLDFLLPLLPSTPFFASPAHNQDQVCNQPSSGYPSASYTQNFQTPYVHHPYKPTQDKESYHASDFPLDNLYAPPGPTSTCEGSPLQPNLAPHPTLDLAYSPFELITPSENVPIASNPSLQVSAYNIEPVEVQSHPQESVYERANPSGKAASSSRSHQFSLLFDLMILIPLVLTKELSATLLEHHRF